MILAGESVTVSSTIPQVLFDAYSMSSAGVLIAMGAWLAERRLLRLVLQILSGMCLCAALASVIFGRGQPIDLLIPLFVGACGLFVLEVRRRYRKW